MYQIVSNNPPVIRQKTATGETYFTVRHGQWLYCTDLKGSWATISESEIPAVVKAMAKKAG